MKILILSNSPQRRLVEEIRKRKEAGIDVEADVVRPSDFYCYTSATKGFDRIYLRGKDGTHKRIVAKDYAAVIPRISGRGFAYGLFVLRHLQENLGIFSTSSVRGLQICSNKFWNAQYLSSKKLRVPKQILSHAPTDYKELIDMVGGFPCVGKLQRGSQGLGVFILNDALAASTALRALEKTGGEIVLQQYIKSSYTDPKDPKKNIPANDLRIWVIGAETKTPKLFAMRRFSLDDDFRSNVSISGQGEKVKITLEEQDLAIMAAKVLGMGACGVDIMRDMNDGGKPYILETNGNPGLKIEKITESNVAGSIIDYVLDNYKKGGQHLRNRKQDEDFFYHNVYVPISERRSVQEDPVILGLMRKMFDHFKIDPK